MPKKKPESEPRERARAAPSPSAFAFTVDDAGAMSGFGKTKLYQFEKEGRLKFIKVDGKRLVVGDSLRALLQVEAA
jgi:hypothetical protein